MSGSKRKRMKGATTLQQYWIDSLTQMRKRSQPFIQEHLGLCVCVAAPLYHYV